MDHSLLSLRVFDRAVTADALLKGSLYPFMRAGERLVSRLRFTSPQKEGGVMSVADQCRNEAEICNRRAQEASSRSMRALLRSVARTWLTLQSG